MGHVRPGLEHVALALRVSAQVADTLPVPFLSSIISVALQIVETVEVLLSTEQRAVFAFLRMRTYQSIVVLVRSMPLRARIVGAYSQSKYCVRERVTSVFFIAVGMDSIAKQVGPSTSGRCSGGDGDGGGEGGSSVGGS